MPLSKLRKDLQEDVTLESSPSMAHRRSALPLQLARMRQEVHQVRKTIKFEDLDVLKPASFSGQMNCIDISEFIRGRENISVDSVERVFHAVTT